MKLLLYCTKAKPYLYGMYSGFETRYGYHLTNDKNVFNAHNVLNGKIVAECDFEVEEIKNKLTNNNSHLELFTDSFVEKELFEKSCLNRYEMFNYLKNDFTKKGKPTGYAIHIKNLQIFDEPRELSDYVTKQCQFAKCSTCKYGKNNIICSTINIPITKAPQNMMYCYGKNTGEKYILISIQPQWLCKILNGEKTIEVRKVVLKEM